MQTYTTEKQRRRAGSGLVVLMVVVLAVSLGSAGMLYMSKQQIYSARVSQDAMRAQIIAEAGANAAYNVLKANFAGRNNAALFPAMSYDGGTYDATVTPINTNKAAITCVGTYRQSTATVKLDVQNFATVTNAGALPRTSPWAYSILCNGYIRHNGSGTTRGSVHVNNYLTANGSISWGLPAEPIYVSCSGANGFQANGSAVIYGTVQAAVIDINGSQQITTKILSAAPTVTFPTPENGGIDFTQYYQIALSNGQVYSSQSLNGTVIWGTIPGGVRWINGNFTQNGSLTYSGCIIATGYVTFNGSVIQTQVGALPAVVSRDSYVTVNGSHTIHGLVYARGDVTWNGAGSIEGSILVGGNMTFNGSYGNIGYEFCQPGSPGGGGGSATNDNVGVTAWQK
jgi:hypothetical protein